jgi:hypothetical protein
MAAPKRVGVKDGQGFSQPAQRTSVSLNENETEAAFRYVRDRILSPALEKRMFHTDEEFGGYFNLGFLRHAVIERLLAQGFAKRANKQLELCRFEVSTLSQALSVRAHLDTLSFRLALPRLEESEFVRIEAAAMAFSVGPRLAEACEQIRVIMSILHESAARPLLSVVTEDLHRQLVPYAYLDRDRTAFENLLSFFERLPRLLQAGRLETLCSELSLAYKQNTQIISPALAEFRRFHRSPAPDAKVARAITFQAAA